MFSDFPYRETLLLQIAVPVHSVLHGREYCLLCLGDLQLCDRRCGDCFHRGGPLGFVYLGGYFTAGKFSGYGGVS